MMKKRVTIFACAMAVILSLGTVTAFATEAAGEVPAASYSYLTGRQRSQSRNAIFAQAAQIESEEERDAFLAQNGINDTEWSEAAAAGFSYVAGQQRGASYSGDDATDSEAPDMSSYSFVTGQQRGSSYHR